MNFKIKNFGKIADANIRLDGITVICGNNNTGKSTVGKALFSFFNSLCDYKEKINNEKIRTIIRYILRLKTPSMVDNDIIDGNIILDFLSSHEGVYTTDDVKDFLETRLSVKTSKEKLLTLINYLNASETDIISEYIFRYFSNVMNGQVRNSFSSKQSHCIVTAEFSNIRKNTISLNKYSCTCKIEEPIEHSAYYINSPFTLDWLNQSSMLLRGMNVLERNVISAIIQSQDAMNEDSMANILDSVLNKEDLEKVRNVLRTAYSGDTRRLSDGKYYYHENNIDFDFRNISAGLKSFALIERLLESGVLKRKDVLILDEPEIHLHSEWQIIYAELIVILQKAFDLTILIVTHSFQFLESLNFFMKKYEISAKGNYYIPDQTEKGVVMKPYGNDAMELKKILTTGSVTLSDLKFKYEMENYREEDILSTENI